MEKNEFRVTSFTVTETEADTGEKRPISLVRDLRSHSVLS